MSTTCDYCGFTGTHNGDCILQERDQLKSELETTQDNLTFAMKRSAETIEKLRGEVEQMRIEIEVKEREATRHLDIRCSLREENALLRAVAAAAGSFMTEMVAMYSAGVSTKIDELEAALSAWEAFQKGRDK